MATTSRPDPSSNGSMNSPERNDGSIAAAEMAGIGIVSPPRNVGATPSSSGANAQSNEVWTNEAAGSSDGNANGPYDATVNPSFARSTHAWAVFGDRYDPNTTLLDRLVGALIICFQLGCYSIMMTDIFGDFEKDMVPLEINFSECREVINYVSQNPNEFPDFFRSDYSVSTFAELSPFSAALTLQCEAASTRKRGVFFSMVMIAFFLTADFKDALRAVKLTSKLSRLFAIFALSEILMAYATSVFAASQNLYNGQTVDAIESSVSLLFIHEVGGRVFVALKGKNGREYKSFFPVFLVLLVIGLVLGYLFASSTF